MNTMERHPPPVDWSAIPLPNVEAGSQQHSLLPAGVGGGSDATEYERDPDGWLIRYWLTSSGSKSPETERTYAKEVRRYRAFLMALCNEERSDLLASATHGDAGRYVAWLQGVGQDALPTWVCEALALTPEQISRPGSWEYAKRTVTNSDGAETIERYRTGNKVPSRAILRNAVITLYGMYNELMNAVVPGTTATKAVSANPFHAWRKQFDRSAARRSEGASKALGELAWRTVLEVVNEIPDQKPARMWALRRRLMFNMLRGSWDRRGAIADATWADISVDIHGIWHLNVARKGKDRDSKPLPAALGQELMQFRREVGLQPVPDDRDRTCSIFWFGSRSAGGDGPISDDVIYREIKSLLEQAAQRLQRNEDADSQTARAQLLRAGAGPHAIRHTMATQFLSNGGDVREAMEILGHSSVAVTSKTYDTKETQRQAKVLQTQWERSGDTVQ